MRSSFRRSDNGGPPKHQAGPTVGTCFASKRYSRGGNMPRLIALSLAALLAASPVLAQSALPPAPEPAPIPISPPAPAAAKQVLGVIVSDDAIAGTVTLATGDTFQLPMDAKTSDLKVGSRVRIEFETDAKGIKIA